MALHDAEGGARTARILLVDDQPAVRQGLTWLLQLEPGMMVVGGASSALEGLALAAELGPDVVIMDVALPGMDGITATALLMGRQPRCMVIVLTIHGDPVTNLRALAAGAWAFVTKDRPEELLGVLRHAMQALAAATQ